MTVERCQLAHWWAETWGVGQAGGRDVWGTAPPLENIRQLAVGHGLNFIKCRKCGSLGLTRRPTLYGGNDPCTDHPIQNHPPPRRFGTPEHRCATFDPGGVRGIYVGRVVRHPQSAPDHPRQGGGAADLERQGWLGGRWTLQCRAAAWSLPGAGARCGRAVGPLPGGGTPGPRDPRGWGVQGPGVVGVRLPVGGDGVGMGAAAGRKGINADAADGGLAVRRRAVRGTLRSLAPAGQLVAAGGPVLV